MLSGNKNKLNGTYVYRHKHNYILCVMFTITNAQLHVSALNVGHLQIVHEELINKLYQLVWGVYSLWGGGVRDLVLCWRKGFEIYLRCPARRHLIKILRRTYFENYLSVC